MKTIFFSNFTRGCALFVVNYFDTFFEDNLLRERVFLHGVFHKVLSIAGIDFCDGRTGRRLALGFILMLERVEILLVEGELILVTLQTSHKVFHRIIEISVLVKSRKEDVWQSILRR